MVAWAAILITTAVIALGVAASKGGDGGQTAPAEATGRDWSTLELQARLVFGEYLMDPNPPDEDMDALMKLAENDPSARLRISAIGAAIVGPDAAAQSLRTWATQQRADGVVWSDEVREQMDAVDRLYAGTASDAVRADLQEEWGWFGRLAVAAAPSPDGWPSPTLEAARSAAVMTMMHLLVVVVLWCLGGVVGLVLLVVFVVRAFQGSVQSGMTAGTSHDGLYAETFVIWLVLFRLMLDWAGAMSKDLDASTALVPTLVAFPCSLIALLWPRLRGLPLRNVLDDIGWSSGRGVWREFGAGLMGYLMGIPILVVGLILMLILVWLSGSNTAAAESAHPIIGLLQSDNWLLRGQVLLLAVVLAPILEETMFRGALYRQLRFAPRWRTAVSVLMSAVVTGIIFAIIHPQGVLAVPVLASMGIAFAYAREWRGSLIAPMVMHGTSNGLTMLFVLVLLS